MLQLIERLTLRLFAYGVILFLMAPMLIVVIAAFTTPGRTVGYAVFPPQHFTLDDVFAALSRDDYIASLQLSLVVALLTAFGSVILGVLAALGQRELSAARSEAISWIFLSPLVLPGVMIGIGMLQFFARIGIPTSIATLVIGHIVVTLPYSLRMIGANLVAFDSTQERASASLGARPIQTFALITMPQLRIGLIAAFVFAYLVSFDDVTISVFLQSPEMVTLPVRLYTQMDSPITPAVLGISALLILLTVIVVVVIERTLSLRTLMVSQVANR